MGHLPILDVSAYLGYFNLYLNPDLTSFFCSELGNAQDD